LLPLDPRPQPLADPSYMFGSDLRYIPILDWRVSISN